MHIADLHLGAPCKSLGDMSEVRRNARDSAFIRLIEIAIKEADLLVIAGDLFDSHKPDEALVASVRGALLKLKSAGKLAILVPGNHDEITYSDSVYSKPGWEGCCLLVKSPSPQIVFEGDVSGERIAVCSCAYTGGITSPDMLRNLPKAPGGAIGIVALHATLDMNIPAKDQDRAMNISSSDIAAAGYKYAALGHIHQGSIESSGGCVFAYPGIIEPSGFGDPQPKGYVMAEIIGGSCRADWAPFAATEAFRAVELDVTDLAPEQVVEKVKSAAGNANYVLAKLSGTVPVSFCAGEVREMLAPNFKYVAVESKAVGLDMASLESSADEHSVRGLFIKNMIALIKAESGSEKLLLEKALWKGLEALRKEA